MKRLPQVILDALARASVLSFPQLRAAVDREMGYAVSVEKLRTTLTRELRTKVVCLDWRGRRHRRYILSEEGKSVSKLRDAVVAALEKGGPMTAREVATKVGTSQTHAAAMLRSMVDTRVQRLPPHPETKLIYYSWKLPTFW